MIFQLLLFLLSLLTTVLRQRAKLTVDWFLTINKCFLKLTKQHARSTYTHIYTLINTYMDSYILKYLKKHVLHI